jgi:hypothetical protein
MPADTPRLLDPKNLTAQLYHRARGNPPSAGLDATIGNTCPGLEVDFRAAWRGLLQGITLLEYDNLVLAADRGLEALVGCRLLRVAGNAVMVPVKGPDASLTSETTLQDSDNGATVVTMEWSNGFADILQKSRGKSVECLFTATPERHPVPAEGYAGRTTTIRLTVRSFFEEKTAVIDGATVPNGVLTQGLCSPWQNDYRECVCYYWASSRPDFVNVTVTDSGQVRGDNWMQHARTGQYVVDDYEDTRLINYDDLFQDWEGLLKFQVGGKDAPGQDDASRKAPQDIPLTNPPVKP